jgi:surface antigen
MRNIKLLLILLIISSITACSATQKANSTKTPAPQPIAANNAPQNNTLQISGTLSAPISAIMNAQDEVNAKQALIKTPIGQEAAWTNPNNNNSYIVRPINEYQGMQAFCRQSQIIVNNGKKTFNTTVCKGSDGNWYIKQ